MSSRLGRVSIGLADHVVSSFTNFAVSVLVATSVTQASFGVFALAFATYLVALGAARALAGEPLMVRFSKASPTAWHAAAKQAMGCAVVVGIVFAVGAAIAARAGLHPSVFWALALVLPGLVLQDAFRYAFFALGRPGKALLNDCLWAALQLPVLGALAWSGRGSASTFLLTWGVSGSIAAGAAMLQARVTPSPFGSAAWIRRNKDLAPRFLAEFGAAGGAATAALYITAGVAGIIQAAWLRGGQVLLGPARILNAGLTAIWTPEAARTADTSPSRLLADAKRISLLIAATAFGWGMLVARLGTTTGEALLGPTWQGAQKLAIPVALTVAAAGAQAGPQLVLRALESARQSMRLRIASSLAGLSGVVIGVATRGAWGATVGLAVGSAAAAVFWWRAAFRELQAHSTESGAVDGDGGFRAVTEPSF